MRVLSLPCFAATLAASMNAAAQMSNQVASPHRAGQEGRGSILECGSPLPLCDATNQVKASEGWRTPRGLYTSEQLNREAEPAGYTEVKREFAGVHSHSISNQPPRNAVRPVHRRFQVAPGTYQTKPYSMVVVIPPEMDQKMIHPAPLKSRDVRIIVPPLELEPKR